MQITSTREAVRLHVLDCTIPPDEWRKLERGIGYDGEQLEPLRFHYFEATLPGFDQPALLRHYRGPDGKDILPIR